MRVLYLTEEAITFSGTLVRGGAIHVRNVVEGLRERGHAVHLVDWNPAPERPYQHSVAPRVRPVEGAVRTLRRALQVGRREGVDVVVSKTRKTYLPGLVAARRLGVPHVPHVGSSLDAVAGAGALDRLDAGLFDLRLRAPHDAYLVVCQYLARQLHDRGVPENRVHDVRNAVDTDRFHPDADVIPPEGLERAREVAGDGLLVSYVGGLHGYKGLFDLAAALGRCEADVTAVLAGDGPAREDLAGAFREHGADAVFLGSVSYEQVPAVYLGSDAFVLPSHTEGLPRVLLEAGACARPAVATRVGGVPEVLVDGETGRLVEPRAPDALAAALADLAGDTGECARLGANARAAVVESFSWPELYDRYERALDAVVG